MRVLYRLQTRLGLTSPEGSALLALALAGALGLGAWEVQEQTGAPSADLYTEADAAFASASRSASPAAQMITPEPGGPPIPLALPDSASGAAVVAAASDSSANGEPAPARPPVRAGSASGRKEPGRANINTGGAAELERLPGVGPALAQRIIDYRNQHGPFRSVDAIVGVKGIGEKTLEKMRPYAHL